MPDITSEVVYFRHLAVRCRKASQECWTLLWVNQMKRVLDWEERSG